MAYKSGNIIGGHFGQFDSLRSSSHFYVTECPHCHTKHTYYLGTSLLPEDISSKLLHIGSGSDIVVCPVCYGKFDYLKYTLDE